MDNIKHTAHFLVSVFINSKHSLKKIYNLDIYDIAILRYIGDSIDLSFKSKKSFLTKIYQPQIATYCRCSLRKAKNSIKKLCQKRLIIYEGKKCIFKLGKILFAYARRAYMKDVGTLRPSDRSRHMVPTSNSSNLTNSNSRSATVHKSQKNEKKTVFASPESQTTSYVKEETKRSQMPEALREMIKSIKRGIY